MTVGEKIQYYRKQSGMSQEELGQKLLVSRQTVSLWEMDKTLPTVENLRLLKDVFSVSVDELLSNTEPQNSVRSPLETYTFRFETQELQEVCRATCAPLIYRMVMFAFALAFVFTVLMVTDTHIALPVIVAAAFLLGMAGHIKGLVNFKKRGRKTKAEFWKAPIPIKFSRTILN